MIETAVAPITVLHLGCNHKQTPQAIGLELKQADGSPVTAPIQMLNLDMNPAVAPDLLCELGKDRIDLPDDSIDLVVALHVLEHVGVQGQVKEWFACWEELYRVMRPGARLNFECPYHTSVWAWADPTHVRPISEMTFLYLNQDAYRSPGSAIPDYRPKCDFQLVACQKTKDHTNPEIAAAEAVSFISGTLMARKPFQPYWT